MTFKWDTPPGISEWLKEFIARLEKRRQEPSILECLDQAPRRIQIRTSARHGVEEFQREINRLAAELDKPKP